MNKVVGIILSISLGLILVASVMGIPHNVYQNTYVASIISISFLGIIVALIVTLVCKGFQSIDWIDVLCLFSLAFYLLKDANDESLWNIGCLSLFLLFVSVGKSGPIKSLYLYYGALFSLFVLSVWGYLQYFEWLPSPNNYFKLCGPYHNPGMLGGMMAVILVFIVSAITKRIRMVRKVKILFIITVCVILFALPILVLTEARAAWLAFIVAVGYNIVSSYGMNFQRKPHWGISIICTVLFVIFSFYSLKPESANGRMLIWRVGCEMVKDNPVTGLGRGDFESRYLYYQAEYLNTKATDKEKYLAGNTHFAFNEPVRVTVESGLVGLCNYLLLSIGMWLLPVKRNIQTHVCKSVILFIFVWSQFSYPNRMFPIIAVLVLAYAVLLKHKKRIFFMKQIRMKICRSVYVPIVCVACVLLMIPLQKQYQSYCNAYEFWHSLRIKEIVQKPDELASFVSRFPKDTGFLSLYAHVIKKRKEYGKYDEVIKLIDEADPTPSLLIWKGEMYQEQGRYKDAEATYKTVASMIPTWQKARYKLALLYHETGRVEEAVALAKTLLTEEVKNYGFETYDMHQHLKEIFREML